MTATCLCGLVFVLFEIMIFASHTHTQAPHTAAADHPKPLFFPFGALSCHPLTPDFDQIILRKRADVHQSQLPLLGSFQRLFPLLNSLVSRPPKNEKQMKIPKSTAILIIIDARYHDFNGFPVVNWY